MSGVGMTPGIMKRAHAVLQLQDVLTKDKTGQPNVDTKLKNLTQTDPKTHKWQKIFKDWNSNNVN